MKNINSLLRLHIIYKMCIYMNHLDMLNKMHHIVNILNQMDLLNLYKNHQTVHSFSVKHLLQIGLQG